MKKVGWIANLLGTLCGLLRSRGTQSIGRPAVVQRTAESAAGACARSTVDWRLDDVVCGSARQPVVADSVEQVAWATLRGIEGRSQAV